MTRAELQTEAEALARELGRTVDTATLTRAKLEELIAALAAEKAAAIPPPEPPKPVAKEPPAPAPLTDGVDASVVGGAPKHTKKQPKIPKVPYYVAPGKATVARGKIAGPLTPVSASDFECGQDDLDYLVARGVIVKT